MFFSTIWYGGLPPKLDPDKDNDEIGFPHPFNSFMTYRTENAETGFGTGSQIDVSHLTEVGLYKYPSRIAFSFIPTLPSAITTLHIQESTSNGKGYWMDVTENPRATRKKALSHRPTRLSRGG